MHSSTLGATVTPSTPPASGLWRQRIGYGLADFACNLIWQMITLYLMYFYTDVMKLPAAQVGALFLLTRIVDGVADVLMGLQIDRTHTRWGKSRPYFLIGAVPFGVLAILAFYVPPFGPSGRLIYAFVTYLGLSVVYTVVNIPMASILPSLTSDAHERTMLATVRILFSFVGATVVSGLTSPLVKYFGGDSAAKGFFWTMVIFSLTGTFLFFATFFSVRERVTPPATHYTAIKAFASLKDNKPWVIFAINIIFMWGSYFFLQGALIYYFAYNVGNKPLGAVIAAITTFVPLLGTFITPYFSRRMLKRSVYQLSSAINLAGLLVMIVANINTTGLIVGAVIAQLGFGLRQSIYFSMQADPVDFGEWKTGVNAAGILSSVNGFIGKIAMAGAGAISGLLLTWGRYVPSGTQPPSALFAIRLNYLILPAGMVVASMVIMSFYNLDKIYPQIRAELDSRLAVGDPGGRN